ncbi:MAG: hypothetical protein ACE5JU_19415 [Candidatus Binatia bacterium]
MEVENVDELEAKIEKLLERHERVRKEKELAEKQLLQKENEFHHLRGQLRQYERERIEIRERLEKILGHFDRLDLP